MFDDAEGRLDGFLVLLDDSFGFLQAIDTILATGIFLRNAQAVFKRGTVCFFRLAGKFVNFQSEAETVGLY